MLSAHPIAHSKPRRWVARQVVIGMERAVRCLLVTDSDSRRPDPGELTHSVTLRVPRGEDRAAHGATAGTGRHTASFFSIRDAIVARV